MVVVFLGPPGSGKGTQAAHLRNEYGFLHFDTGAELRAEVARGTELGQTIGSIINAGNLVPIEVIRELILRFIRGARSQKILFDGFPRNIEQAEVLDDGLAELGDNLDHAIYINLDRESLLARIVNRKLCEKCGAIYNMVTNPPAHDGLCDLDNSLLVQRADDTQEVFSQRLKVYLDQTVPVLEYYRAKGILREVNGAMPVDELTQAIISLVGA